jgi:hypothetical protein
MRNITDSLGLQILIIVKKLKFSDLCEKILNGGFNSEVQS